MATQTVVLEEKKAPTFNSKGTPCNVVPNCGKVALYHVGQTFGCGDHKAEIYAKARSNRTFREEELPEVDFTPEIPELDEL